MSIFVYASSHALYLYYKFLQVALLDKKECALKFLIDNAKSPSKEVVPCLRVPVPPYSLFLSDFFIRARGAEWKRELVESMVREGGGCSVIPHELRLS